MNDILIKIDTKTAKAYCENNKIGVQHANLQNKLIFEMSEKIIGSAWLEYEIDGIKNYAVMEETENGYQIDIKSCLLVSNIVNVDLKITESENADGIPIFVSTIVELDVDESINATEEEPEYYPDWKAVADSKIAEMEQLKTDVNAAINEVNNLDIDVSKNGKTATIELTKKDSTTKTVTLSDGTSLMFNWDGTRLGIKTDEDEEYVYVDLIGRTGPMGPQGEAFQVKKTYANINLMIADYDNMQINDYVMIDGNIEQEDNAKLFVKQEIEDPTYRWHYLADFSGATGIQGPTGLTPNIQIGSVTSGISPSVTRTGTNENPILNFVLEKGEQGIQGIQGETGNGIASITKTSTVDTVDTYTILYTDGTTSTFTVTNGEVSQAQLNTVQSQVDKYKTLSLLLPKVEGEGTSVELSNTVGGVTMDTTPEGATSQESTTGANLQKYNVRTTQSGSLNYSCDNTGQVNVTGTKTGSGVSWGYNLSSNKVTLEAGTYVLNVIGYFRDVSFKMNGTTVNIPHTFTLTETTEILIEQYFQVNITYNSDYYITLAKDTATTERYTGGLPSPSQTYPQPIKVVTGNQNIKVQNKNLLNLDDLNVTYGTISGTRRYGYKLPVFENKTYYISLKALETSIGYFVIFEEKNGSFTQIINPVNSIKKSFTTEINKNYYILDLGTSDKNTAISHFEANSFMLSLDNSEYIAPKDVNYPISLGTIKLVEIGEYQDYIYGSPNNWYSTNYFTKIESYNGETITTEYLSTTGGLDIGATVYYYNGGSNPLQITDTTLITQLNNLYNAVANQDTTHITCSSASDDNETLVVKTSTYKDISSILNPTIESEGE